MQNRIAKTKIPVFIVALALVLNSAGLILNSGSAKAAAPVPAAPYNVDVEIACDSTTAVVSWTPGITGGPYISYTATSSPDGLTATVSGSIADHFVAIGGLTMGPPYTFYTFTVTATNASGTSVASPASNSITPHPCPSPPAPTVAPTGVVAIQPSCDSTTATISWAAPTSGGPYTSYSVGPYNSSTNTPTFTGPLTATVSGNPAPTSVDITGLTIQQSYTFGVTATNASGTSVESWSSPLLRPVYCPATNVVATIACGSTTATLSWTAPASGSPWNSYTASLDVFATPGGSIVFGNPPPTTMQSVALTIGQTYSFTIKSDRLDGQPTYSSPSNSITPYACPPPPPSPVFVTAAQPACGVTTATISWFAPPGPPYTSYTATSAPDSLTGTSNGNPAPASANVSGLTIGTAYTFTVTGTTADGTSAASGPSNSTTPFACPPPPSSPVFVTAAQPACGVTTATISWFAPPGPPYTSYTATSAPDSLTGTSNGNPAPASANVSGLTIGTAYTFTVTGTTADGTSAASGPSNSITPFACPSPPEPPTGITAFQPTCDSTTATVSWGPPADGQPYTSYTVTSSPDGVTSTVTGSPANTAVDVPGLTLGTTYTFTVTATNTGGTSVASTPSNSITPIACPPASADIAITKTVDNPTPNLNDNVTFTITATNNGPDIANGIQVSDPLPSGLSYQNSTATQGDAGIYFAPGSVLVWPVGTLLDGNSATLTMSFGVGATGTITNTATKTAETELDPNTNNDSASATIIVPPAADIYIQKSVDNPTPDYGANVTYTITATNYGPSTATGVQVTDLLPAGLSYVSSSTSQGTYDNGTGLWDIGTINCLDSNTCSDFATLTIIATATGIGTITNTATKTAEDEFQPYPSDDSADVNINVAVPPTNPPTGVTASQPACGITNSTISWTAPANGQPYTSYTATSSPSGLTSTVSGNPAAASTTISGLTIGTAYTFTVTATNPGGTSDASGPSNSIAPNLCPVAPTNVVASISCGSTTASIAFTAPASGGPYTSYTATAAPGGLTGSASSSPATVAGLAVGTTYTFTVTATNTGGTSVASDVSNSITPVACPSPSPSPSPTPTPAPVVVLPIPPLPPTGYLAIPNPDTGIMSITMLLGFLLVIIGIVLIFFKPKSRKKGV